MSEGVNRTNPKPPSVDRLSALSRRINDRKIVQWSVAYVAIAYALQHGVILISESLEWPNIVARVTLLLLFFGLPLVMTIAWYHGERASRRISGPELTIIALLLAVGSLWFYVFVRPASETAAVAPPTVQQGGLATARAAASSPKGAISIAVLPFANLSGDAAQEFFSDGMTEEITSALAKVPDLRVVGRTSAFQFKGQNQDLRVIGQSLAATHLIEGSVRKAGDRLRITVQLIKADDGTHVWSEDYDRELTDVFAVQEDIARAITESLRMPLGLRAGESLVSNRTNDLDSYQQYLRAKALVRGRGGDVAQAITILESVVSRDPGFAPAWALLSRAEILLPNNSPAVRSGSLEEARKVLRASEENGGRAAREAIRLDPRNALGYLGLARIQVDAGKWIEAEDLYKKALEFDPNEPEVLDSYANRLADVGRLKEALSLKQQLRTLEPFVPVYSYTTAAVMQYNGQNRASIPILEAIPPDAAGGANRNIYLARAYATEGRYSEAAGTLLLIKGENVVSRRSVEDAVRLLRQAPTAAKMPQELPSLDGDLNFVYAHVGALEHFPI